MSTKNPRPDPELEEMISSHRKGMELCRALFFLTLNNRAQNLLVTFNLIRGYQLEGVISSYYYGRRRIPDKDVG